MTERPYVLPNGTMRALERFLHTVLSSSHSLCLDDEHFASRYVMLSRHRSASHVFTAKHSRKANQQPNLYVLNTRRSRPTICAICGDPPPPIFLPLSAFIPTSNAPNSSARTAAAAQRYPHHLRSGATPRSSRESSCHLHSLAPPAYSEACSALVPHTP